MGTEKRLIDVNGLLKNGIRVSYGFDNDGEVDDVDFPAQYLCRHNGADWNDENHFCGYGERKEGSDDG